MLLPYLIVDGSEVLFAMLITIFGSEIFEIMEFKVTFWFFVVLSIIVTGTQLFFIKFNWYTLIFLVFKLFFWIQSLRLLKYMEICIKQRKEENKYYDKMRSSVFELI